MTKKPVIEFCFDRDLSIAFFAGLIITAVIAYLFVFRPYQRIKAVRAEIHECQGKYNKSCDYYCWRPPREGCLAMPKALVNLSELVPAEECE